MYNTVQNNTIAMCNTVQNNTTAMYNTIQNDTTALAYCTSHNTTLHPPPPGVQHSEVVTAQHSTI